MKKIILLVLVLSVLLFTTVKVNAEEIDDESISSTPETEVENEVTPEEPNLEDITVEEELKTSELEIWFEENLGWVVGIPTGMITTLISLGIFVIKTKKKFDEANEETSSQNKNTKVQLEKTKELVDETKKQNEIVTNKIDSFIKSNENQIALLTKALETMTKAYEVSTAKISALEDVIELMALHSKELVANGTAEKITKKIRG